MWPFWLSSVQRARIAGDGKKKTEGQEEGGGGKEEEEKEELR